MDAQVLINSVDVSDYVISIKRSKNYCNVSQEFSIELDLSYSTSIDPYNTVIIYEEGTKVLTGYVTTVTKSAPEVSIRVDGQDVYKKAADYFVPTLYTTQAGQRVRHWVEFLLDLVGLTASFPSGSGPFVAEGEEIGLDTISNLIEPLIQYAGWYGKVDADGNIYFSTLSKDSVGTVDTLITFNGDKSYDKTRNLVHVHGGVDTSLNQFRPIFAKARVNLAFLPVDQTVVIGNHLIGSQSDARSLAKKVVNELGKPTYVKTIQIIGTPDLAAGEYIDVQTDQFVGTALITSLNSNFSENGYLIDLILDDLCPRLIAHITPRGHLYAGTTQHGVYKHNSVSWGSFNTGLTGSGLRVIDLSVDNGLHIVATSGGIYTRVLSNPWIRQNLVLPAGATNPQYPAVYATVMNSEVNALVNYTLEGTDYCSLYTGTLVSGGTTFSWSGYPILASGVDTTPSGKYYTGLDMEGDFGTKYIVASYATTTLGDGVHYISSGVGNRGIGAVDLDGNNESTIFRDEDPSNNVDYSNPSPDGTQVAFAATLGTTGSEIYIRALTGTENTKVTDASSTSGDATFPAWSPDGTKLVYVYKATPASASELYVINTDGTNNTQITNDGGVASHPDWSAISDEIVYDYTFGGSTTVYKKTVSGSRTSLATTARNPSWTSQNKILYTNIATPSAPRGYRMDSDGSNKTQIYAINTDQLDSDEGYERIVYKNTDDNQIYMTSTSYTIGATLIDNTISVNPAVIPNDENKKFIFGKNDSTVRTKYEDGSNDTTIYTHASNNIIEQFNWDMNGSFCAAISYLSSSPQNTGQILRLTPTAGIVVSTGSLSLANSSAPRIRPKISRDGQTIAFSRHGTGFEPNRFHVYTVDSSGGTPVAHTTEAEFPGPGGLTTGCFMRQWTPNDEIMFFRTDDNRYYIGSDTIAAEISDDLGLLSNPINTIGIEWHPTEYKYILSGSDGTNRYFYLVEGESVTQLSIYDDSEPPLWSHNGEHLVYKRGTDFYTCKADGTGHTFVLTLATALAYQFTYDDLKLIVQDYQTSPLAPRTKITSVIKLITEGNNSHPKLAPIGLAGPEEIRLLETFFPDEFILIYSGQDFSEVNVDTSLPISVYGSGGLRYSPNPYVFDGLIASGINVFDVAAKRTDVSERLFATTPSGIYSSLASGVPSIVNNVSATEIVARSLGNEEVYFSINATVKKSTDDGETYSDFSSGLPGSTITVLRIDE